MSFSDDFTGTNGQALSARSGWTLASGTEKLEIRTDRAAGLGAAIPISLYLAPDQATPDIYVKGVFLPFASGFADERLCGRVQDVTNHWCFRSVGTGAGGWTLKKVVDGTPSDGVSFQGAPGAEIEIRFIGDLIEIFKDGVSQGSVTDATFNTQTGAGLIAGNTTAELWERFEVGVIVAVNPIVVLKKHRENMG